MGQAAAQGQRNKLRPVGAVDDIRSVQPAQQGELEARLSRVSDREVLLSFIDAMGDEVVAEHYELEDKLLGVGSFGVVRRAVNRTNGQNRAVKEVTKDRVEDIDQLRSEVRLLRSVDHPNLIRLFETFEDSQSFYLVLEYCAGGAMTDLMNKNGLPEDVVAAAMKQVLTAIAYLHSLNIVHRDVKPDNFLFLTNDPRPERSPLKLIDFGLAARFEKGRTLDESVGTPCYVAPEVISRSQQHGYRVAYTEACDIWSAGVLCFEMLAGHRPFDGGVRDVFAQLRTFKGPIELTEPVWKRVSDFGQAYVQQLLCRDPQKRPTAQEALEHSWIVSHTHRPCEPSLTALVAAEVAAIAAAEEVAGREYEEKMLDSFMEPAREGMSKAPRQSALFGATRQSLIARVEGL